MNQQYIDLIGNLFTMAITQLLHKWTVYPDECFQLRTAVGLTVQSLKQSILSDYIQQVQSQIIKLLPILQCIEVCIINNTNNEILQTMVITIDYNNINTPNNTNNCSFNCDIQLKSTLYQLLQQLNTVPNVGDSKSFVIRFVSNGLENSTSELQDLMISSWIQIQSNQIRQTQLVNSMHFPQMDIMIGLI